MPSSCFCWLCSGALDTGRQPRLVHLHSLHDQLSTTTRLELRGGAGLLGYIGTTPPIAPTSAPHAG
jgi:hypothetical protein